MSDDMQFGLRPIHTICRLTGVTLIQLRSTGKYRISFWVWFLYIIYCTCGGTLQILAITQQISALSGGCDLLDCYVGTMLLAISCCVVSGAFVSASLQKKVVIILNIHLTVYY